MLGLRQASYLLPQARNKVLTAQSSHSLLKGSRRVLWLSNPSNKLAQCSRLARKPIHHGLNLQARAFSCFSKLRAESPVEDKKITATQPLTGIPSALPTRVYENIYTLPNFLTTTRIIATPIIGYAILHSQPYLAFGLFAYSGITDLVDGWIARTYKSGTVLGSILDPFADKLLMAVTTLSLYSTGVFPWWLTLIIFGRDGLLALSALYFRYISLEPPRTMKRYWDFSLPSAEVKPTEISKINTMLQLLLVANAMLLPVLPDAFVASYNLYGVLDGWMGLVAGTTLWSGLSYIFTKDAIVYLGPDGKPKKKQN